MAMLLLVAPDKSFAEDRVVGSFSSRSWSVEQGLEAGQIQSITQAADGYLWLGTEKGLLRFNGLSFHPVPLPEHSGPSSVLEVVADREGVLWFRTKEARLFKIIGNNRTEMVKTIAQEFEIIPAVTPACNGGLLVASAARGLVRLQDNSLEDFHTKGPDLIVSLAQSKPSEIWLGTRGQGLYRWSGGAYAQVPGTINTNQVTSLLPDSDGRLWVGTDQGLYTLEKHGYSIGKPVSGTEHLQVLSLVRARDGSVWMGTSSGLVHVAGGRAEWIQRTATAVTALLADREGDLWFGDGPKLVRLRQPPILTYQLPASIVGKGVGAVATDKGGRVWFAGLERGLYWMEGVVPHRVTVDGLGRDTVYSIDCIGRDIWLGRRKGGLTRIRVEGDRISARTWTMKDGLVQNSIFVVRALPNGNVWAGSLTKGLSQFQNGRFQNFHSTSVGADSITAIEPGADGSVYVATPAGLYQFRGGIWRRVTDDEAGAREALSLFSDGDLLLVGTEQGLEYLARGEQKLKTITAPILRESVLGLTRQGGVLWLTTPSQLLSGALENAQNVLTLKSIRSHGSTDGLSNSEGIRRTRSIASDESGHVYVATNGGLSAIGLPGSLAAVPALAHVSAVEVDGTSMQFSHGVKIPAGTERTTLSFDGLDFSAPEQVRLRYKLDGFDREWGQATVSQQATYTNLPPGPYTFHLIAQNEQGEWPVQGASLQMEVEPIFIQRRSVQLTICGLLLGLAVWIYQARIQFVVARANAFADERIMERTRIARELHDTLLQGFISALMHLHIVHERTPNSSGDRESLLPILQLMEQVIEEGRLAVQGLRNTDGEVKDLEGIFSTPQETVGSLATGTSYTFSATGHKQCVHPIVCEEVGRIGREALSNAFLHAQARNVEVRVEYLRTSLEFVVRDDGIGISLHTLNVGKLGHWGLLGMRERAKHIGACLEINSHPETGTNIRVSTPARFAYRKQ